MTGKEKQNLATEITERISKYVDDLFIDYHNVMEIESGDVSPVDQYFLDYRQKELTEQIVEILDRQKGYKQMENQTTLCGFVYHHGEKDFSALQVELSDEDREKIDEILMKYDTEGCSVRNVYDSKFNEVF